MTKELSLTLYLFPFPSCALSVSSPQAEVRTPPQLYTILRRLFTYYATLDPAPAPAPPTEGATEVEELELAEDAKDELWLTRAGLDAFAKGTNGKGELV